MRHLVLTGSLFAATALVYFGDNTGDTGVAEAAERRPPKALAIVPEAVRASDGVAPSIMALVPRATLIGNNDEAMGSSALFGRQDWTPPPAPPPERREPEPPPPPPMAPPLPFLFLGKAAEKGEWEVFLARGEKIYVVRKQDVIDGTYRVDAIVPPHLTLTYLPLNQVQQLNIGVLD